ncbi:UNVERIFIED_CONTAM: hypothetical protein Sangu_0248700 [Sesamum angustifolium]|uniref:Uncharacterized protein n=1 Tax=Sesamum angustifolium TaxID=2727405 RepID=A0AAW2RP16_9LAMI
MGCGISRFVPRQDQGRTAPQLCTRSGEYDHDDNDDDNPSTMITKKNNAHLPSDVDHVPSTSFHAPQLQTTSPNNNNNNIVQRRKPSAEAAAHHYNDNDGASGPMFMDHQALGSTAFRATLLAPLIIIE